MTASPASPPRAVVNAHCGRDAVHPPAGPEVQVFHQGLDGYRPTPLHSLTQLAAELAIGAVSLKDESDRFGLPAFKILGASWAVERMIRERPDTHTLIAASAGNHGRAVARAAADRGLQCRIYLPAGASPERAAAIRQEGAEVVLVRGDYDAAIAYADSHAVEPGNALVADTADQPTGGPPAWVVDGYSTMLREVSAQAPDGFDLVLVPAGVGSLAAAVVRWTAHEQPGAAVVAVEPTNAACITTSLLTGHIKSVPTQCRSSTSMAGMDCPTPSACAWPDLRAGLAGAITVSDDEVREAMRALARAGLTIGDCGAAPVAALRALVADRAAAELKETVGLSGRGRVLCLATEGASDPRSYAAAVAASG